MRNFRRRDFRAQTAQILCINTSLVNAFGKVSGTSYSSLPHDSVLISDTALYCVTENKNTVKWSYVDLADTRTDLTSTTNSNTGVSIIQVYTTQPGYYSCKVTENGGSSRTYTAVMTDTNPDTGLFLLMKPFVRFNSHSYNCALT